MNIFEQATRKHLLYPSNKGELTTEQLWELPLISRNNVDLNTVAKAVNQELKSTTEESFVPDVAKPKTNDTKAADLELKMAVIKHIIAVKADEEAQKNKAAEIAVQRKRLEALLAIKEEQELQSMSKEDIQRQLAELGK